MNINEKQLNYVLRNAIGINAEEKLPQVFADLAEIRNGAENIVRCIAEHGAPYAKTTRYAQRAQVLDVKDVLIGLAVIAMDKSEGDPRIYHDGLAVNFKEGWASEADLRVEFRGNSEEVELADGTKRRLAVATVQISWSSTHRSTSDAAVALRVYQQAVELGQLIESTLERFKYVAF